MKLDLAEFIEPIDASVCMSYAIVEIVEDLGSGGGRQFCRWSADEDDERGYHIELYPDLTLYLAAASQRPREWDICPRKEYEDSFGYKTVFPYIECGMPVCHESPHIFLCPTCTALGIYILSWIPGEDGRTPDLVVPKSVLTHTR